VNPIDIANSSADPAFVTEAEGRIVAWNRGAEKLFGYARSHAVGQTCWDLLSGRDVFGNRYCGPVCPLMSMVQDHEAVHRCELVLQNAAGEPTPVHVSMFALPAGDASSTLIVHILTPAPSAAEHLALPAFDGHRARPRVRLTPREVEVLMDLAEGKATNRIAAELGVSVHTVRNHVDRLFKKLHAHSRLEVVAAARRLGLI
jgi:PAS domain S-box-containing protein